ncbi:MAG: thioredoxin [Haloquadratum sp. J07HQX50]|jgi:Thioredoxin.|nr:MAG: thioredoxin [Haloquadratum sp. J07HQX50]
MGNTDHLRTDMYSEDLETMQPTPAFDSAGFGDEIAVLASDEIQIHVWGGDWCGDCRRQLPDFAAALQAADIPPSRVHNHPVEKDAEGNKAGPLVDRYNIEYIPTVVVEQDGTEIARFVESAPVPIVVHLAEALREG